jgi:hypothetical protein
MRDEDRWAFGGHRETPLVVLDWDTKYEKALKKIRDMDTDDDYDLHIARHIIDKMRMIARKALEAK